jgi:hypothetical protein
VILNKLSYGHLWLFNLFWNVWLQYLPIYCHFKLNSISTWLQSICLRCLRKWYLKCRRLLNV